jgi:hypothetical protein
VLLHKVLCLLVLQHLAINTISAAFTTWKHPAVIRGSVCRLCQHSNSSMASAQKGCISRLHKEYKGLLRVRTVAETLFLDISWVPQQP